MSTPCILVVDDNPTNLKLVSDVLASEGYEILNAIDAEKAEEVISQRLPDLVLLDIALPGMDGLMLTRKLRGIQETRHLPIVALTAFAMKGDAEKASEAGCNGYITKPVDTRTLPSLVAQHLSRPVRVTPSSGLQILVIEDTPSDMKLAQHVLASAGHHVDGAGAAEQAILAVKQNRPQVILLDLVLPGINGLELARMLKADPETCDIRIVAVTSFPERFPKADAFAAGCDAYLTKPISTGELPGQLEDIVNRLTSSSHPKDLT